MSGKVYRNEIENEEFDCWLWNIVSCIIILLWLDRVFGKYLCLGIIFF